MEKVINSQFVELIKGLTLRINLSLKGGNLGSKRSTAKGSSIEFSDYREYVPGDDFRRIDWNAMARFERVFLKLFMQEQESPVTLFIDHSESMEMDNKRESAIKIGASFSYIALSDYDAVSMVMFSQEIDSYLHGIRGSGAFNKVVNTLESIEFKGGSDLLKAINSWQPRFRKGITIIISDLMYDSQLDQVMKRLAFKKQRVILCHVLSDKEINPVFEENVRIIDSETDEFIDIDTGIRAANIYQNALSKYVKEIKGTCSKYGADYFMVNASTPIEQFLKNIHSIN